jgi:hypothetical protein
MKYVTVRIGEIVWCDETDDHEPLDVSGLPTAIETYEVETDEVVHIGEKWNDGNCSPSFERMCEDLADQLSDTYGFLIAGMDDIEVLKVKDEPSE